MPPQKKHVAVCGTNYSAALSKHWSLHVAERAPTAPTVISTFAGCGGSSLGYSMAGFRELLAVEQDANAVATLRLNFPGIRVFDDDIRNLSAQKCMDMAGVQPGELDVLDGSPPCQGFSTAGRRREGDARNGLFYEYIRLLSTMQPRVFVAENVPGMVSGKMKRVFVDVVKELRGCGYQVSARLLYAADYAVPQLRERLIIIGTRDDTNKKPTHPTPTGRRMCGACAASEVGRESKNKARARKYNSALHRLQHGKPSNTITADATVPGSSWPFLDDKRIDDRHAKILSSFPERFVFAGTWKDAAVRIGNCVPPLFMYAIAKHIRENILDV